MENAALKHRCAPDLPPPLPGLPGFFKQQTGLLEVGEGFCQTGGEPEGMVLLERVLTEAAGSVENDTVDDACRQQR